MFYLTVLGLVAIFYVSRRNKDQLPHGPRGIPFIGVLPEKNVKLYQQLHSLVSKYGDFFSFNLGRSKVVILSSPTAINDLIVKKGQIYSSRTSASAQGKIVGQSRLVGMQYGDEFRVSLLKCFRGWLSCSPKSQFRDTAKSSTACLECTIQRSSNHIKSTRAVRPLKTCWKVLRRFIRRSIAIPPVSLSVFCKCSPSPRPLSQQTTAYSASDSAPVSLAVMP